MREDLVWSDKLEVQEEVSEKKMLIEVKKVGNVYCRSDKYNNGNQVKNRENSGNSEGRCTSS